MLKPQQHRELLLHDPPPVFGKPWFWQRSSSTMESTRSLAQVITEMRDEIKKLEAENRELRGDGQQPESSSAGMEENPYVNLRRNASAPVLEGQYKENTVMTVRRYSIGSSTSGVTPREGRTDRTHGSSSGWERLQKQIQHRSEVLTKSAIEEVGKFTNRHSMQEPSRILTSVVAMATCTQRTKVKTVTFLLPVDDIYTNRPVLTKRHEEPRITELAPITETDS